MAIETTNPVQSVVKDINRDIEWQLAEEVRGALWSPEDHKRAWELLRQRVSDLDLRDQKAMDEGQNFDPKGRY